MPVQNLYIKKISFFQKNQICKQFLVRGKRIPYREAQKRAEQAKESGFLNWGNRVFVLSILFLGAAGFWLLKPSKRKEEKG